jgi:GNAT superfamily N-acetyltransferase
MIFANVELARRLEAAEGSACAQFAEARAALFPDCGSLWREIAGATVVFDGVDAPTTQTFGLGLFAELTVEALDEIEAFFESRGAAVMHEVSPLAGAVTLDLLCARGYRPFEVSSVLYRAVEEPAAQTPAGVSVRIAGVEDADDAEVWSGLSAKGWAAEHPEMEEFVREMGAICVARKGSPCFLGEVDGVPGATGILSVHEGVALFAGASTVPELRRRGLQAALLEARMRWALEQGCDLAMMVTEAGSNSQRNAERKGFRVAYTRLKWRLVRSISR